MSPTLIHEKKPLFNTGDLINNESTLIHEKKSLIQRLDKQWVHFDSLKK